MPEITDVGFGFTAAKCEECDAFIIYGHNVEKSSGTMLIPRCIAIDKKQYTCNGRMVEGKDENVRALLASLVDENNMST